MTWRKSDHPSPRRTSVTLAMSDSVYTYDPATWEVTQSMKDDFNYNGYLLVRNLLSPEEITKLKFFVENNKTFQEQCYSRDDGQSRRSRVVLWNHPGDDVTGKLARIRRVAGTMEELLGGDEIYHYHSKLMMKDAKTGGRHVWHQDYGYWYNNGCLYPDMGSVFIPVDACTKQNSCLQILKGSHRIGRIDHIKIGDQLGADPERVEKALDLHAHLYVEMAPGDALFFHSNLLHTSDQNSSHLRRWVFIVAFNKRMNNPFRTHHHPQYTPMEKVHDSALMECSPETSFDGKWFMKLGDDISVREKVH